MASVFGMGSTALRNIIANPLGARRRVPGPHEDELGDIVEQHMIPRLMLAHSREPQAQGEHRCRDAQCSKHMAAKRVARVQMLVAKALLGRLRGFQLHPESLPRASRDVLLRSARCSV